MREDEKTPEQFREEIAALKEELRRYRDAQRGTLREALDRPSGAQVNPGHISRILDSSPVAVGISRLEDGFILYQNDRCAEMFGVEPAEPRNARDFWADLEDRREFAEAFRRGITLPERPIRFLRKDGSQFWSLLTWDAIDVGGQSCVLFWLYDITRLKETEDQLRLVQTELEARVAARTRELDQSERDLRSILESLVDGLLVCSESGRITQRNAAAEQLCSAHLEVGARLVDVLGADLGGRLQEAADDAIASGCTRALGDLKLGEVSDSTRWLNASVSPKPSPAGRQAVFVLRDVTAQRHLEAELRHSARMDSLGRLAGGIAHDFNNLLTAILGNAELAALGISSRGPRESIDRIVEAAQRATALTQGILAFARRQTPEPAVHDLNQLLLRFVPTIRRLVEESIELVVEPASAPVPVEVDNTQIDQVLMNLILNARDSISETGKITVRAVRVQLPGRDNQHPADLQGEHVCLSVSDTGSGISDEILEHLFEPFFTTKNPGDGSGLGLSICYGIITQHGGRILAQSAPGRGSQFRVYLPLSEKPVSAGAEPGESVPLGSETVLVVEDEASVRKLAVAILERQGYRVLEARNGVEALQLVDRGASPPSLILSDLVMPELGGIALAEELERRALRIPILFMSGFTERTVPRAAGGRSVPLLHKPFTLSSLTQAVRQVLDEARA